MKEEKRYPFENMLEFFSPLLYRFFVFFHTCNGLSFLLFLFAHFSVCLFADDVSAKSFLYLYEVWVYSSKKVWV